jgi:hypothetical protein
MRHVLVLGSMLGVAGCQFADLAALNQSDLATPTARPTIAATNTQRYVSIHGDVAAFHVASQKCASEFIRSTRSQAARAEQLAAAQAASAGYETQTIRIEIDEPSNAREIELRRNRCMASQGYVAVN